MKRNYFHNNGLSLSQTTLRGMNILTSAKRDFEVLNPYGVTLELLTSVEQKLEILKQISNHELDAASRKELVFERNRQRKQLQKKIALVQKQLFFAFEKGTSGYDVLFSSSLSNVKLEKFVNAINNFVFILQENSQKLVQYNFTAERFAELLDLVTNFITLHEQISGVHHSFRESAAERSMQREEMFRILRYIAAIGRTYWKDRNPILSAQYNISRKSIAPDATDETTS